MRTSYAVQCAQIAELLRVSGGVVTLGGYQQVAGIIMQPSYRVARISMRSRALTSSCEGLRWGHAANPAIGLEPTMHRVMALARVLRN